MGVAIYMTASLKQSPEDVSSALDALSFYIGRAYYNYVGCLERGLVECGLHKHVSPGMGHVLFALFEKDDRIIKDLAKQVKLSYSTMTGLLTRMERAGLIECRKDPADGRATRVKLTSLARTLEARCFKLLKEVNGVMQSGMSDDEIRSLKQLLSRMIETLSKAEEGAKEKRR
jgi:DNA-binding MarR family transcriptional regulator